MRSEISDSSIARNQLAKGIAQKVARVFIDEVVPGNLLQC